MELLKVNDKLLLEIPLSMINKMGIRPNENIAICERDGEFILQPTLIQVINKFQDLIAENSEGTDEVTDEEVIEWVKEIRKGKKILQ
ncbi:MAG: hypothetical protein FWG20_02510 [Candidatus Cloacimonetes bacterium]|nr:hypothetical protein [Candidatus Cloacimonadota bacterium]